MNPGTSIKVTTGILKASQNLMNLAAFTEAFISKTPARTFGCCPIIPTVSPAILENPTNMLPAKFS